MGNNILKIGHRGAKGLVTENTIASIEKALSLKVDGIEIDVHRCKSGELVVFHDFTLDRLTNGTDEVSNFTLAELKKLKVEKRYSIPTLEEVLDLVNCKCFINIELKGKNTSTRTVEIIEDYIEKHNWKYDDFIVSSFQHQELVNVYNLNKQIALGVLTKANLEEAIAFAKEVEAKAIHPNFALLSNTNVKFAKDKGYKVNTWTVNNPEAIKRMKKYKVDAIISDFPDRL